MQHDARSDFCVVGWPLLAISACGLGCAQTATFLPKFRADAQLVLVPVTVTDHYGKTIQGLHQENFTVLDGQTPQQIVPSPAATRLVP